MAWLANLVWSEKIRDCQIFARPIFLLVEISKKYLANKKCGGRSKITCSHSNLYEEYRNIANKY